MVAVLMAYAAGVCQDVARCHPVAYTSCFVMAALCAQPDRDLVRRCATLAFGAMWAWAGFFKLNPKLTTESEFKGTVEVALFPLFSVVGDDMWMDHSERIIYGAAVGEMVCGLVLVADSFGLFPRRGLPHFAAGLVFAGHAVTLGSSLFLSGGFGLRADMRGASHPTAPSFVISHPLYSPHLAHNHGRPLILAPCLVHGRCPGRRHWRVFVCVDVRPGSAGHCTAALLGS